MMTRDHLFHLNSSNANLYINGFINTIHCLQSGTACRVEGII